MRILIDECIDRRLAEELSDHDVKTVPQMGWASFQNGRLLKLAEKQFDVFITVDRNLSSQQTLSNFGIAVLVLRARTNRLVDLKPLISKILKLLPHLPKARATFVS